MYIQSLLTGHSNHSSMTIWGKKPRITSPGLPTQRYCNVWILSNWTFMWALQRKFSHRTELWTYLMLLCKGGRSESSNRSWSDCLCLEPLQTWRVCHILQTNRGEMSFCLVIGSLTYRRIANPLFVASKITSSSLRITGMDAGAASGLLPYLEDRQRSLGS